MNTLFLVFLSSKLMLKSQAKMTSEWVCSNKADMGGGICERYMFI